MYKSDLDRLSQMTDEDIDYSDLPPLTDEQLAEMKPLREVLPQAMPKKVRLTLQLDTDIVQWFQDEVKRLGHGSYQVLLNTALRQYIENRREALEDTLQEVDSHESA